MSTIVFSGDIIAPMDEEIMWATLVTPFESGKEQRRNKWSRPKRRWFWGLEKRSDAHIEYITTFYNDRKGSYDTFYWENPIESPISVSGDEAVGVGNGSNTAFTLDRYPVKTGSLSLKVGGVAQTEGIDYTLNATTGAITMSSPPASGDAVVATDYNFYRIVRFEEDKLTKSLISYKLYNSDIKVVEVL